MKMTFILFVGLLGLCSCQQKSDSLSSGIDRSELSAAVKPGDDFFDYCNQMWNKKNPIPADRSSWGVDAQIVEGNLALLKELVESQPATGATENGRKLRDFYATAMDEAKLNREGIAPLKDELAKVEAIKDTKGVIEEVGRLQSFGTDPLFSIFIAPDHKQSDQYIVHLFQGGTSMPERDYYLKDDEESKRVREGYMTFLKTLLGLAGEKSEDAAKHAAVIYGIEKRLAETQMSPTEAREVEALYNKMDRAGLAKLAPEVKWDSYFAAVGIGPEVTQFIVGQPEFFKRVSSLLKEVSIEDWRVYLRYFLVNRAAPRLSDEFVKADHAFYAGVLEGASEIRPRWKRAIKALDENMGEALGQLYVEKRFSPQAKQLINEMVDNIVATYEERIMSRPWLDSATKKEAVAKLHMIARKLGYPDKWRDYSKLEIKTDSYVANYFRGQQFEFARNIRKLGKPVDRAEWDMTPSTVNAYYDERLNCIAFPAGILQPPYFDPKVDDAFNYGGIGATIGHELTHGFDDQGSKFDGKGNMRNWWTDNDRKRFEEQGKKLIEQFNGCVAVENLHVNGELTLGENIADLGGLVIALEAYKRSLKGKEAPVIDGFTGVQRFFIGYGISWRGSERPEQLKTMIRSDEHAPPHFRVNVPLSNMPEFFDAFGVKAGEKMYRAKGERVEVW